MCLLPVNDIEAEDENDRSSSDLFLGTTKLYIVVGCVAALLALALLQASCTLYRSSKRRATKVRLVCVCLCIRTFSSSHIFFSFSTFLAFPGPSSECVVFCCFSNDLI